MTVRRHVRGTGGARWGVRAGMELVRALMRKLAGACQPQPWQPPATQQASVISLLTVHPPVTRAPVRSLSKVDEVDVAGAIITPLGGERVLRARIERA